MKSREASELTTVYAKIHKMLTSRVLKTKLHILENKIYTDQTGIFPVTSSKGNKYIIVAFEADSNNIVAEPMKSRKA